MGANADSDMSCVGQARRTAESEAEAEFSCSSGNAVAIGNGAVKPGSRFRSLRAGVKRSDATPPNVSGRPRQRHRMSCRDAQGLARRLRPPGSPLLPGDVIVKIREGRQHLLDVQAARLKFAGLAIEVDVSLELEHLEHEN